MKNLKFKIEFDPTENIRRISRNMIGQLPRPQTFKDKNKYDCEEESELLTDPRIELTDTNEKNIRTYKVDIEIIKNRWGRFKSPGTHENFKYIPIDEIWIE